MRSDYFKDKVVLYYGDEFGERGIERKTIQRKIRNQLGRAPQIVICKEFPKDMYSDVLFFDWGGLGEASTFAHSLERQVLSLIENHPQKDFVVTSSFTPVAMKEATKYFGVEAANLFLDVKDYADHIKKYRT